MINVDINKKSELLNKMNIYLNEYLNNEKFNLDNMQPMFHINMNMFTNKIKLIIHKTENEVSILVNNRQLVMEKISQVDQKINLVQSYANKMHTNILLAEECLEQNALDDIASTKMSRGEYE